MHFPPTYIPSHPFVPVSHSTRHSLEKRRPLQPENQVVQLPIFTSLPLSSKFSPPDSPPSLQGSPTLLNSFLPPSPAEHIFFSSKLPPHSSCYSSPQIQQTLSGNLSAKPTREVSRSARQVGQHQTSLPLLFSTVPSPVSLSALELTACYGCSLPSAPIPRGKS